LPILYLKMFLIGYFLQVVLIFIEHPGKNSQPNG
jgi:hypothetical protein